jgi:hypothetical protein
MVMKKTRMIAVAGAGVAAYLALNGVPLALAGVCPNPNPTPTPTPTPQTLSCVIRNTEAGPIANGNEGVGTANCLGGEQLTGGGYLIWPVSNNLCNHETGAADPKGVYGYAGQDNTGGPREVSFINNQSGAAVCLDVQAVCCTLN